MDTDIIGLDGKGGIASDGELGNTEGPDNSDGSSNEFASGPPAKGEHRARYQPGQQVGDVTQREEGPENQNST